ncbi:MAG: hypothetical protein JEZ06_13200 [Anaerolineaceae bacterium]|nr:hypothetical protein [Anaerolineaceae bacterium]
MSIQNETKEIVLAENAVPILPKTWDRRMAKWVSNAGNPISLAIMGTLISAKIINSREAWHWIGFLLFTTTVLPASFLIWLVKKGKISDFDVYHRTQRRGPYIFILSCMFLSMIMMWLSKAPAILSTFITAAFLQTIFLFAVNSRWKISAHSSGMAGFVTIVIYMVGSPALPITVGVPLMIWARVRLRRHTFWQTVAGTFLGAAIYASCLILFL